MKKGMFITGTGTDVGKTFVSALLLKKLLQNDINAGYYKPALSGAVIKDGELIPGDAEYACNVSGLKCTPKNLVTYCFKTPVSPHLAAKLEYQKIEYGIIENHFSQISKQYDYMIVEGCGGIVCPLRLDESESTIMLTDIIKMLDLDIIIVALAELGTINATVLTVEYAKNLGINIKGIILNRFKTGNFLHEDNKKQLERLTKVPVISCVSENASELDIDLRSSVIT